jgi:hypothetical protein
MRKIPGHIGCGENIMDEKMRPEDAVRAWRVEKLFDGAVFYFNLISWGIVVALGLMTWASVDQAQDTAASTGITLHFFDYVRVVVSNGTALTIAFVIAFAVRQALLITESILSLTVEVEVPVPAAPVTERDAQVKHAIERLRPDARDD